VAALGIAGLVAAACGSAGGAAGTAAGSGKPGTSGTITVGTTLAPTTLDPGLGTSGADYQYLYFLFDRLIQFNPRTGALEPMLATSWHFAGAGKLELVVNLRHGVKFQDGTPLTAAAVASYSKTYIKEGDVLDDLQFVTDVTASGNFQVIYHLSQQNSQLPYGLADRAGMIPSPTAVQKEGKNFGTHPVGAGPYQFAAENAGSSYSFTRWPGYWNNASQPRIQHVTYQIFQNDTSLATAARSRAVSIAVGVFPQDVQQLKAIPGVKVSIGPGTGFDLVYFNGALKPFTDPRMRLAFNLALNRTAIMDAATDGLGKVWTQPVPPGTAGYVASLDPVWTYDPARARQLVKQAGYPNGVNISCYTYPGLGYDITAPVLISQLKAVGINMKVISGTPAQVVPFYTKNLAPCYLSGWGGGANPVTTYEGILWSKSYYNAGKTDFGVDKYINQFFSTYSAGSYNKLFYGINQAMKNAPGYAVEYANPAINVYASNVGGWRTSPFGLDNFQGLYLTS
jgi:peptide/nickel transport system substrate-binding protein